MNYQRIYNELMQRACDRDIISCYTENHHIIPRCVIKDDSPVNITTLTAREHFIAHWLLVKMYKDTPHFHKLLYAFCMMRTTNRKQQRYHFSSRLYAYHKNQLKHTDETREKISRANKGKRRTEEHKKHLSDVRRQQYATGQVKKLWGKDNPSYGRTVSEETREKMSIASKGRKDSQETIQKKRERMLKNNHMKGRTHSTETRKKISDVHIGRKQTPEHIINKSKHMQGSRHMYLPETGERCLVQQDNIDKMLRQGYSFGMKPPKPPKQKKERTHHEKRWMFDPLTKVKVLVNVENVDEYLEMGFIFGMK